MLINSIQRTLAAVSHLGAETIAETQTQVMNGMGASFKAQFVVFISLYNHSIL